MRKRVDSEGSWCVRCLWMTSQFDLEPNKPWTKTTRCFLLVEEEGEEGVSLRREGG
jgi:hypothetical protein